MNLSIGIDPGLSGALAILAPDGTLELVADLPIVRDRSLAWVDGGALQSMLLDAIGGRQSRAVVERVSAMPKQGVTSSFQFGVGFDSILSVLQVMRSAKAKRHKRSGYNDCRDRGKLSQERGGNKCDQQVIARARGSPTYQQGGVSPAVSASRGNLAGLPLPFRTYCTSMSLPTTPADE